jgi:hypothetical protein
MERRTEDEILIRMYLLGEVRDKEQEQTEQRLLTDREFFEDFLRLEESLIDEYVRGSLSKHEQERFEAYFLKAPERRASVDFDRALRRNLSGEAILIGQKRALSDELAQQLNQTQSKLDEKEQEIAKLRQAGRSIPTDVKASVVSMFLAPELGRGEGKSNRVYISNRIDRLRLKLEVDGDGYKKYRAEVQTAEGKVILRSDNLKLKASRRGKVVEVELAATRLTEGDYIIVLSGATGDGDYEKISAYHFRVTKR